MQRQRLTRLFWLWPQVLGTLGTHGGSVEAVGFCDVLPYAASAGLDGQVMLYDVQARSCATHLCRRGTHAPAAPRSR